MIKDIKSKFPYIADETLQEYYYTYTKLKHKALKDYGFKFNIEIGDDCELSEYGFSSITYDDLDKKATGSFNLGHMVEQMKILGLDEEFMVASTYGTLLSSLFHSYIKGIMHFNYKDEISKYNLENPSIDFIHLYFCEDILNFPNEQIFTKLNYLLQEMYSSGEFKDRDELADYCVNVLNPIAFKIARNHTEFMMYEFKNTKQKKELINEPGEAPNAN